jgi:hypothetical protein
VKKRQIGLRGVVSIHNDGILDVDDRSSSEHLAEQLIKPADTGGVSIADGTHLNDLTVDQLQALALTEDASFDHLVIFSRGKATGRQLNGHVFVSTDMIALTLR